MNGPSRTRMPAFLSALFATVLVICAGLPFARGATTGLSAVISGGAYAATTATAGFMSAADKTKLGNYADPSGLTTGAVLRATGATSMGFGQVDLANSNAVTGLLPIANVASGFLKSDGSVSLSGALNLNSHLINNVTDPSGAQDAATKAYSDARKILLWGPWGNAQNSGASSQRFLTFGNTTTTSPSSTESDSQTVAGVACTATDIYVKTVASALATDTQAITLRVNGSNSALTCTVSASGSACNGSATVAIAATDLVSVGYVQSGTQTATSLKIRVSIAGTK